MEDDGVTGPEDERATHPNPHPNPDAASFERRAAEKPPGLLTDLLGLVRQGRKWWLVPILVLLLVLGLLLILAPTVLGPFLYPLF